jgi:hypothetical protein
MSPYVFMTYLVKHRDFTFTTRARAHTHTHTHTHTHIYIYICIGLQNILIPSGFLTNIFVHFSFPRMCYMSRGLVFLGYLRIECSVSSFITLLLYDIVVSKMTGRQEFETRQELALLPTLPSIVLVM